VRLRVQNIGAAAGRHDLGEIDGPDLYALGGDNGEGKTTLLRLLEDLGRDVAKAGKRVRISHGAAEASLEIGDASFEFRYSLVKDAIEVTSDGETLPVTSLPEEILRLVDPKIKGDEERLKARLDALVRICQIEMSESVLDALLDCLPTLGIEADRPQERAMLVSKMVAGKPPVPNAALFLDSKDPWRKAALAKSGLVEGAGEIIKLSHAVARSLEVLAERKEGELKPLQAQLREANNRLEELQKQRGEEPLPEESLDALGRAVAAAEASSAARQGEEVRRARLATQLGARPEDIAEGDIAKRGKECGRNLVAAQNEYNAADAASDKSRSDKNATAARLESDLARLNRSLAALGDALSAGDDGGEEWLREYLLASHDLKETWGAHRNLGLRDRETTTILTAKFAKLSEAQAAVREIQRIQAEWQQQAQQRQKEQASWDALNAQLQEPLEGATLEEVEKLRGQLRIAQLQADLDLATAAAETAQAGYDTLRRDVVSLTGKIKAWRDVGPSLWKTIGQLVGRELELPWLRVEDMRILVGYTSKGKGAKLALDSAPTDWRDLDEVAEISTGEISEACLHLFVNRAALKAKDSILPPIVTIPWHVLSSIVNPGRLAGLRSMFKAAGVIGIGEVPSPGPLRIYPVGEVST
jgi:hypothetical protein